jgi:hypothetical protein
LGAEFVALTYLKEMETVAAEAGLGLSIDIKSFVNRDGTVDAELRLSELPDEWKLEDGGPLISEFLSQIFELLGVIKGTEDGGRFWVSVGFRFGPSNEAEIGELVELYKRHRGLFQIASYPVSAEFASGLQNAVAASGTMATTLGERRGLYPAVVIVRLTWMPSGQNPSRYKGEKGGGI